MRRLALCLWLAACAPIADEALPPGTIPLRNPTLPVASQADVSAARLAGDWVVVSGATLDPGTRLRVAGEGLRIGGVSLPLRDLGQGRFALGDSEIWVHWMDADNRTAAMGDPGGSRVWIMDRTGRPGDRLRAAREILEWYGYDLTRLHEKGA